MVDPPCVAILRIIEKTQCPTQPQVVHALPRMLYLTCFHKLDRYGMPLSALAPFVAPGRPSVEDLFLLTRAQIWPMWLKKNQGQV